MKRLVVLIALAACNDDVDLTGTYLVTAHGASAPCGADTPVATPAVSLVFTKGDLFGQEYFTYKRCTDAAGTMCSGGGLLGNGFAEPIDGGWVGVITSSGAGGGSTVCTINYTRQTAMLAGTALVVEISQYSEEVENTEALCDPAEAERRNTSMPCVDHENIDATRQ